MPARTTTHIAGPCLVYDGRVIQRCAVCGKKLVDMRTDPPGVFGPGGYTAMTLIQEKGSKNGATSTFVPAPVPADQKLPPDNCFALVEECW